mmetsp:Transcript_8517/g.16647  ORF Transcript_8517/g.16647 Transcript_8517/m.16647 type:complete len:318 (+) Transcript_8517:74-1027(+)
MTSSDPSHVGCDIPSSQRHRSVSMGGLRGDGQVPCVAFHWKLIGVEAVGNQLRKKRFRFRFSSFFCYPPSLAFQCSWVFHRLSWTGCRGRRNRNGRRGLHFSYRLSPHSRSVFALRCHPSRALCQVIPHPPAFCEAFESPDVLIPQCLQVCAHPGDLFDAGGEVHDLPACLEAFVCCSQRFPWRREVKEARVCFGSFFREGGRETVRANVPPVTGDTRAQAVALELFFCLLPSLLMKFTCVHVSSGCHCVDEVRRQRPRTSTGFQNDSPRHEVEETDDHGDVGVVQDLSSMHEAFCDQIRAGSEHDDPSSGVSARDL